MLGLGHQYVNNIPVVYARTKSVKNALTVTQYPAMLSVAFLMTVPLRAPQMFAWKPSKTWNATKRANAKAYFLMGLCIVVSQIMDYASRTLQACCRMINVAMINNVEVSGV